MSPAFLGVVFCSAVKQIAKNTRSPEKFHAQIFNFRKLCKKAPTSIKKRFKYFRKILVAFSFFLFFILKCHFSLGGSLFFPKFFTQHCSKWIFSFIAILPTTGHYSCTQSVQQFRADAERTRTEPLKEAHWTTFYEVLLPWFEMRKCVNLNNWKLISVLSVKEEVCLTPAAILNHAFIHQHLRFEQRICFKYLTIPAFEANWCFLATCLI